MSLAPFETLFDPFLLKTFRLPAEANAEYDLMMNLIENEQEYRLEAEVPGCTKEMIKIESEEHFLRIFGELTKPKEDPNEKHWITERSYGKFDRKVRLPRNADMENISATCENGILKLTIPKTKVEKPLTRAINIQ